MKNKKINISLLALGMMAIGAVGSVAYQSFAQTSDTIAPVQSNVSEQVNQVDQNIDQKDINGKDIETNDGKDIVSADVLAQVKISELDATKIALNLNPNNTVKSIVVGDENGKAIYEIKLSNNSEIKVDAVNGTIVKDDQNNQGDNDSSAQSEQGEKDSGQPEIGE